MYKRPKASDTEADILRFQRQFQQEQKENTVKLAATVVSAKKEGNYKVCSLIFIHYLYLL